MGAKFDLPAAKIVNWIITSAGEGQTMFYFLYRRTRKKFRRSDSHACIPKSYILHCSVPLVNLFSIEIKWPNNNAQVAQNYCSSSSQWIHHTVIVTRWRPTFRPRVPRSASVTSTLTAAWRRRCAPSTGGTACAACGAAAWPACRASWLDRPPSSPPSPQRWRPSNEHRWDEQDWLAGSFF